MTIAIERVDETRGMPGDTPLLSVREQQRYSMEKAHRLDPTPGAHANFAGRRRSAALRKAVPAGRSRRPAWLRAE